MTSNPACRSVFALTLSTLAAVAGGAHAAAAEWPQRPIRPLVPFPPAGGVDTVARILTPRLHEALGQQWVIDNRAGAGGNIAAEIVARASPDGYTALLGFSTILTVNPGLYKLPFDVEKDLAPVAMIAAAQYMLALNASVKANSVKELVALARAKPKSINYASPGVGTAPFLAMELFKSRTGTDLVHIPYKGAAPATAALLAGEAQVLFGGLPAMLPHIATSRLRGIAVSGRKRADIAPEVPTMIESGYANFEVKAWYALLVPSGTPAPIIDRLQREVAKALQATDVREAIARQGLEVETMGPRELASRIAEETKTWTKVIRDAGIRPE